MLQVPLYDDEILASYVSRLAYAHGIYRMRTFCGDVGLNAVDLKNGVPSEVEKLSKLIKVPLEPLLAATVTMRPGRVVQVRGQTVQATFLKREYMRFCPHCLMDDLGTPSPYPGSQTYYRAIWFFPQVTACIKHERAIIEIEQVGSLESTSHDFCAILGNLPDGIAPLLDQSLERRPTDFEKYVAARLAGADTGNSFLDALGLEAVVNMCERFGVAASLGHKAKVRHLTPDARSLARDAGFKQLAKGKRGVFQVLDKLAAAKTATTGAFSAHGLYGELYQALNVSFKGPDYEVFRELIRKHSLSQKVVSGTMIFGLPAAGNLVRLQDVASELGVTTTRLKATLLRKGKKGQLSSDVGTLNSELRQEVQSHVETVWTFDKTRQFLGCDLPTLGALRKNILRYKPGYTYQDCDKRDVMDLDRRLREKCVGETLPSQMPVIDAAWKTNTSYATIIQLILDGKLRNVSVVEGQPILAGLRVEESEVEASHFPPGTIPAIEAGKLLHLRKEAIGYLIKCGLLNAVKLPPPRSIFWAVQLEDVERFKRDFISLAECETVSGRDKNSLRMNARRQGINPAFLTALTLQAIYERRFADVIMAGPENEGE